MKESNKSFDLGQINRFHTKPNIQLTKVNQIHIQSVVFSAYGTASNTLSKQRSAG